MHGKLNVTHESEELMAKNPVVHFEIYGDDPDKLQQFYTGLFDWSVNPIPGMGYRLIKTVETDAKGMPAQAGGINGGMLERPTGFKVGSWVSYVSVESVDAALERAQTLGGKVTRGKAPVPGMGWFAMLADPQGNSFAIWQDDPKAQ